MAVARLALGHPREAATAAKEALELDERSVVAMSALGKALRQLGDAGGAEGWEKRANAHKERDGGAP